MQEVSFEEALEIILLKDPRYHREAYFFVREALDHTQKTIAKDKQGNIRHVSGQELLAGIREFATTQFGPMAMLVLAEWGVHSCQDFGEIVFNMVETGGCPTFCIDDLLDLRTFAARLQQRSDPVSSFLWEQLSEPARQAVLLKPESPECREILVQELNAIIRSGPIYEEQRFLGLVLSAEAKCLVGRPLRGTPLAQFNRLLLESVYPAEISKCHGLLAKTKNDTRADFRDGYDFFEAFRKPFLPPSRQAKSPDVPAPSHRA